MKHLYPTYRGTTPDGQVRFDMVDRYGRTWATGVGADRVQAQMNARHNMPPKNVIRGVLAYARAHPVQAAFATSATVWTYQAARDVAGGRPSDMNLPRFLALAAISYIGIKIITAVARRAGYEDYPQTIGGVG